MIVRRRCQISSHRRLWGSTIGLGGVANAMNDHLRTERNRVLDFLPDRNAIVCNRGAEAALRGCRMKG
jgi:hypothetical protein